MEREIHQTVEQSQSGGVSGLIRVCAGVKGEEGECVCVWGGWGRGDEKRKGVESVDVQRRKSVRRWRKEEEVKGRGGGGEGRRRRR